MKETGLEAVMEEFGVQDKNEGLMVMEIEMLVMKTFLIKRKA